MADSKTDQIRALLQDAAVALSAEEIHAQVGGEPGDEVKTSALLTYLRTRGEAKVIGRRGAVFFWAFPTRHVRLPDEAVAVETAVKVAPPQQNGKRKKSARQPRANKRTLARRPVRVKVKTAKPERQVALRAPTAIPAITPPGSIAVADDGSVVLLDGDLVTHRLTPQQATNIAALVARHTAR